MSFAIQTDVKEAPETPAEIAALEAKVSVRRLNFYYGAYRALADNNVELYKNKVTAFIGPSGCGKSTLLRILNRIYDLYPNQRAEGEVLLDGENILSPKQDLNMLRAKVGMVFQKPTPFPMTIYDNIAFGVRLYEQLPKSELDARVEDSAQTRRLVGRGQGQARRERPQPVRRPAAAAVHRPHRGHPPGGDPAR